jgi:probable DNA repair protein
MTTHFTQILPTLNHERIILTPNRRLAVFLHAAYQQHQLAQGETCWETPTILPVNVWIDKLWTDYTRQTLGKVPQCLNAAQEQQLWESVLNESSYHDYFLQVSETSRLVKSARSLLKQWQVTTDHPLFDTADDYTALTQWLTKFDAICTENEWIDNASLPDQVINQIREGSIQLPSHIYHAGFTDLSPQLSTLLALCPNTQAITLTQNNQTVVRTTARDPDDEIRMCARWAKMQHEHNPDKTIGCVIPLLDKKRDRVVQLFSEVFGSSDTFNLSAGLPLVKYPVIHAALECLALYKKQISCESLFFILSTPFIGGGESERIARSQFDGRLRGKNFSTINLDKQLAKNPEAHSISLAKSCPLLAKRIRQFKALLEGIQHTAPYAYWAQTFNQLLTALGWPGERVINSEEYQVVDEWLKLLHDLTTLDITAPPVQLHQALRTLAQMAGAKPFQPQSPSSNVQILGVLEAAGLNFDYLWISGMDDSCWPSQPKPNPFIPKKLQRELKMPHASAERELEYCQTMTQQFMQSAPHVIFSYAKNQDKTILQPSPLIRALPLQPPENIVLTQTPPLSDIIFKAQSLEKIIDHQAPAHLPHEAVRGGVEIIKNQALCPFKAFAECRLGARELESPLPGLRPKERGTIVHQIMEKCWDAIQSWENLHQLSQDELRLLLDEIIVKALLEHAPAQAHQSGYLALERQRLLKLAIDWLEIEKQRAPFIVLNSEKSAEIKLNALTFTVRIDRIDQLEDGNKLIIDYKTGTSLNVADWLGDRPKEPQLPLYAQLDSGHTAGIAFAQIAAGNHCFKGISQYPLDINGIKTVDESRSTEHKDWKSLTEAWQTVLKKLGNDFYQGVSQVDPKEKTTCKWCALKPLCRVHQDSGDCHDE